jgi:hypothetical protein
VRREPGVFALARAEDTPVNDTGEQEVRAREEENRVAFLAADLAALDRLWTEDFDRTRREIGGRTPDPRGTRAVARSNRREADKSGQKLTKSTRVCPDRELKRRFRTSGQPI